MKKRIVISETYYRNGEWLNTSTMFFEVPLEEVCKEFGIEDVTEFIQYSPTISKLTEAFHATKEETYTACKRAGILYFHDIFSMREYDPKNSGLVIPVMKETSYKETYYGTVSTENKDTFLCAKEIMFMTSSKVATELFIMKFPDLWNDPELRYERPRFDGNQLEILSQMYTHRDRQLCKFPMGASNFTVQDILDYISNPSEASNEQVSESKFKVYGPSCDKVSVYLKLGFKNRFGDEVATPIPLESLFAKDWDAVKEYKEWNGDELTRNADIEGWNENQYVLALKKHFQI